ncbi:SPOR domain-containing protein [Sphingomonas sp. 1P06PA]|uniref:SPOR domain-containing protein n=1 Tax=Sphingomonas sp. 1P06PA TaxID=554121 RepID=UPI0039A6057F
MKIAAAVLLGVASLMASSPALASVKDGVDLWQAGDYTRAVAEWKAPATAGDADAQFNLAQAYKLGRGVPTDLRAAEGWYKKAAAQGHEQAQATLGLIMFQNGDRAGALPWLKQAAERGEPRAQYVYGTALFNGDLVARDWPRAYAMMTRAAASGLPQATASLQQMDQFVPTPERQKGIEIAKTITRQNPAPAGVTAPAERPVRVAGVAVKAANELKPAPVRAARTKPAPVEPKPVPAPVSARPKPEPAAAPVAMSARPVAVTPKGKWRVQLGAFGAQSGAQAAWTGLAAKAPALRGLQPQYVKAGTVTRLQAAGLADRAAADRACSAAKAAGSACFTVAP